jgi:hypothetical protein
MMVCSQDETAEDQIGFRQFGSKELAGLLQIHARVADRNSPTKLSTLSATGGNHGR